MRRCGVRIATNRGPVTVLRFSHEPAFARSKLWLHDGERASLDRGERFAGFVDDLGPILLRGLGVEPLPPGMYMEIDQDIDAGRSWQLGTLVAMLLASAGRLAGPADADARLVFCTGEVAHSSGAVRPVELVAAKLAASRAALAPRPADCLWLIPKDNAAEAAGVSLPEGVTRYGITRIDELPALLGLADSRGRRRAVAQHRRRSPWLAAPLVAALIGGALVAAPALRERLLEPAGDAATAEPPDTVATAASPAEPLPTDPLDAASADATGEAAPVTRPAAAGAPPLAVELGKRRPQPGQSCLVQNFDRRLLPVVETTPVPRGSERLPALAGDSRLCGVDIGISAAADQPVYVLGRIRLEPADAAELEQVGQLDGLSPLVGPARLTLRLKPDRVVTYHLELISGTEPVPGDALGALGEPDGRTALEAAGFDVQRFSQTLEHARPQPR